MVTCILCGAFKKKGSNFSLHSIPKDPVRRRLWIEACKLHKFSNLSPDELSLMKICSAHFDADSYIPEHNNTGPARLKPDAIPRLEKIVKHEIKRNSPRSVHTIVKSEIFDHSNVFSLKNEIGIAHIARQTTELQPQPLLNDQSNHEMEEDLNIINDPATEKEQESDLHNENTEQVTCTSTKEKIDNDDGGTDVSSGKRRKILWPTNVAQLTEEQFATPRRRKLHLSLIKRKLEEQEKTIRSLRKQKNRLIKQVANFSSLLAELKDKKLITVDGAKVLLICEK